MSDIILQGLETGTEILQGLSSFSSIPPPTESFTAIATVSRLSLALSGVQTSWTGSPFSLISGPGTIASQSVSSNTVATVVLNVTGPGSFVLSDGTSQITVAQPSGGLAGVTEFTLPDGTVGLQSVYNANSVEVLDTPNGQSTVPMLPVISGGGGSPTTVTLPDGTLAPILLWRPTQGVGSAPIGPNG